MVFKNKNYFKEWKFYFKLGFGLFFLAVLLYGLLSPLINGITVSEQQKTDARNWQWFTQDKGDYILNYFSFFTIQTNIFVSLWLIFAAIFYEQEGKINSRWFGQYMALAITTYITITGLVFNVMLLPTIINQLTTFYQWFTNVVQHMVVPIVMIIYFFMMARDHNSVLPTKQFWKKRMGYYYIYPIVWVIVMEIRGEFRWQAGKVWAYQYFFLNFHKSFYGLAGGIWFLIATVFIILIIFGISTLFNWINFKQLEYKFRRIKQVENEIANNQKG